MLNFNSKTLDELAARIGKAVEASPAKDIEKNVKAMLQSGLARLDVVPRAEFDTQAAVLAKTREKLERLEARVAELETRFGAAGAADSAERPSARHAPRRPCCGDVVAIVHSRALVGVDAPGVTVEVHIAGGLPGIHLVGLPDTEVREARDRVRAALQNAQFEVPARKVTVNLAPADLPKESGRYDLPIALGILAATGQIPGRRSRPLRVRGRARADRRAARRARRARDGAVARGATAARSCCRKSRPAKPRWCRMPPCTVRARCSRCARTLRHASRCSPTSAARRTLEITAAGGHSLLIL